MSVEVLETVWESGWIRFELFVLIGVVYYVYRYIVGTYCVFDFQILHDVVRQVRQKHQEGRAGGQHPDLELIFEDIRKELSLIYPGHVSPKLEWIWCHAGGCLWSYAVIHVSLTEYVIFTGTGSGTDGLTGRHIARISDIVVHGSARYTDEHTPFAPIIFSAGDTFHLQAWETQSINIPEEFWLLEYGRGFVPLLLPFGFVGSIFSTLDFHSICRTIWVYSKFMVSYLFKWPTLKTSAVRAVIDKTEV
mmetsp:Transcript_38197/g.53124  ORF Transcript_38197/g.53124 Transcript_38197/m.53124 type:complete len:248 (+) Transcript_38197:147-890(+)